MSATIPLMRRSTKLLLILALLSVIGTALYLLYVRKNDSSSLATTISSIQTPDQVPPIDIQTIADGLDYPWEVAITPNGEVLYTEREGNVGVVEAGRPRLITTIRDVRANGEGGLMGMILDPEFTANRTLYVCLNAKTAAYNDVRVVRFKLDEALTGLTDRLDIVTGIPSNSSGRHSGCRLQFGADGNLWIGTGDAATGSYPQSPTSLGGKILRVDRNGKGVTGNLGGQYDGRIFSYGHRNTQGLAMLATPRGDVFGYSVEHGPDRSDEINALVKGNFGWDPVPSYNETVSMTDTTKFPGAVRSLWNSGSSGTIAPSGATMIQGDIWGAWNGALAVAVLKDQHMRVFTFDERGGIQDDTKILIGYGRIRSVVQAPDGSLYVTTDNGKDQDKILKLTPQ